MGWTSPIVDLIASPPTAVTTTPSTPCTRPFIDWIASGFYIAANPVDAFAERFALNPPTRLAGRRLSRKYHGSELIGEAQGPDFQTAMIQTTVGGLAVDEPWTAKLEMPEPKH
jgi:hypothetical protein